MSASADSFQDNSVSAMLLRLQQKELLVPKALIADVLTWNADLFVPASSQDADWKLGQYDWHAQLVSLLCFERLMQTSTAQDELLKRKVVILKACQPEHAGRFYAIHCKGFPKPLILSEQSLNNLNTENNQQWIAHSISIGSRVLDVPDFAALEDVVWFQQAELHRSA